MKKALILITAILFSTLVYSQNIVEPDPALTGTWHDYEKEVGDMELALNKDGFMTITSGGTTVGGKITDVNGKKTSMTYVVNTKTTPRQIDFIVTDLSTNQVYKMVGIYELKSPDELKIAFVNESKSARPESFEKLAKGEYLNFIRIKNKE